ncbi:MAG: DEAD/DEAH box helicase [Candidatus Thermoplasmatota archaeon]|nr:DEAD/DEAH box helicase [Candidatus Thermoplasmatota archaeon]
MLELLDERVVEAAGAIGIEEETEPQRLAIPLILSGKNVLTIAPTGYGKTEAAMLPVFSKALEDKEEGVFALYVTPLRALNRDMLKRLLKLAVRLDVSIAVRHGDTPASERAKQTRKPPKIMITTPETLQILLTAKRMKNNFKNLRFVIIDEIHELVDNKRGAQLAVALERLQDLSKREIQRIGLSATVGNPEEVSEFLCGKDRFGNKRDCAIVDVSGIKRMRVEVIKAFEDPIKVCRELIEKHNATLLFTNTRETAEYIASEMDDESIGVHHGSLSKEVRIEAEDAFKEGRLKALICTSSLELGIDVGRVDFVIQYNSPRQVTRLLQRVGRSMHRRDLISEGAIIATNFDEYAESLAIKKLAEEGRIERARMIRNPLDVLANQIVGILLSEGGSEKESIFATIKRAYPFYGMEAFDSVVEQLAYERIVGLSGDRIFLKRKGFEYYFTNLSMIPDERVFSVIQYSTRKRIGNLDESFVSSYVKPQSTFIFKGETWEVVKIEEDRIIVEKKKSTAAIPSWIGEEIPVPFEVAQEVGRKRKGMLEGQSDDKTVTVESDENVIVINCCFGTLVNESLSRYLSSMLLREFGESFSMGVDPCRIVIKPPRKIASLEQKIIEYLLSNNDLRKATESVINGTYQLRYVLFHVARRFGAIKKSTSFRDLSGRVFSAFDRTPIYDEALREMFEERLDVSMCEDLLRRMREGEINVKQASFSEISRIGLTKEQIVSPLRSEHEILSLLKERLENSDIMLFCMNCKKYQQVTKVRRVSSTKCPLCGSIRITVLRPWEKEKLAALRKKNSEEEKVIKDLYVVSNLFNSYGKSLLLAIAANGVGATTAMRVLRSTRRGDEETLLRKILEAELTYARTKDFWD